MLQDALLKGMLLHWSQTVQEFYVKIQKGKHSTNKVEVRYAALFFRQFPILGYSVSSLDLYATWSCWTL